MILSILICSRRDRRHPLNELLAIIMPQFTTPEMLEQAEVCLDLSDDPIQDKRNALVKQCRGKYIWFINDGDHVSQTCIQDVLKAVETDPDFVSISGLVTIDNKNPVDFHMSIAYKTSSPMITGDKMILCKAPGYTAPIKKEIVQKIPFTNKSSDWSRKLVQSGLLKTEAVIDKPIYHLRHCADRNSKAGN